MKFELPFLSIAIVSGVIALVVPITPRPQPRQATKALAVTLAPVVVAPPPQPAAPMPKTLTGCAAYLPIIQKYDWDSYTAQAIMRAENGACNPTKDNAGLNWDGSVDYGLFQVNSIHAEMVGGDLERLRDPETNVRIAHQIYVAAGWTAWSTFKSGAYLKYL